MTNEIDIPHPVSTPTLETFTKDRALEHAVNLWQQSVIAIGTSDIDNKVLGSAKRFEEYLNE